MSETPAKKGTKKAAEKGDHEATDSILDDTSAGPEGTEAAHHDNHHDKHHKKEGLAGVADTAMETLSGAAGTAKDTLAGAAGTAKDTLAGAAKSAEKVAGDLVGKAKDFADSPAATKAQEAVGDALSGIAKLAAAAKKKATDALGKS